MKLLRITALLLALLFCVSLWGGCTGSEENVLSIAVLDVGQSDCILLSLGDRHMLIDAGSATQRAAVLGELSARGVDELEYLLVTHAHEDHYGNARAVLETRPVGTLLVPEGATEDLGYGLVLQSAEDTKTATEALRDGDSFYFGDACIEVFCALSQDAEGNNASLVLRISFGECVLLFMGDAEKEAEQTLLSRDTEWDCDFLKVGHHGSRTACSQDFLAATTPQIAAISCGKNNDYGFPHREVLQGLVEIAATIYRTDEKGNLNFICDGKSVIYEE